MREADVPQYKVVVLVVNNGGDTAVGVVLRVLCRLVLAFVEV